MTQYRKKPVVIEAFRLGGNYMPGWFVDGIEKGIISGSLTTQSANIRIKTLEGFMSASTGDWIIKGVKGELYPCKHDIFEATYEVAAIASGGECRCNCDPCRYCEQRL